MKALLAAVASACLMSVAFQASAADDIYASYTAAEFSALRHHVCALRPEQVSNLVAAVYPEWERHLLQSVEHFLARVEGGNFVVVNDGHD